MIKDLRLMILNNKGIMGLFPVVLMLVLMGFGVYLVQQRTNLIPFAYYEGYCEDGWMFLGGDAGDPSRWVEGCEGQQDETDYNDKIFCDRCTERGEGFRCEGEKGNKSCIAPQGGQNPGEAGTSEERCEQPKYYCDYNVDENGRRILKTGGYYAEPGDSQYSSREEDGCVYDYQNKGACRNDGSEIIIGTPPGGGGGSDPAENEGNNCPDNGLIYCDGGKSIEKYDGARNKEGECEYKFRDLGESEECSGGEEVNGKIVRPPTGGGSQSGGGGGGAPVCQSVGIKAWYDGKVATNLMHYKAIIAGAKEVCVKADLGMPEHWYAQPKDPAEGDDYRRLFLCSGADSTPGNPVIKWRVISSLDPSKLVQIRVDLPTDPNDPGFKSAEYAVKAENKLQVSNSASGL